MLNNVILVGRVTKPITNQIITLAVNRNYKNIEGMYETDFIDIYIPQTMQTQVTEYCQKGDLIGIKGRIETSINDTEKTTCILAERVTFLSQSQIRKEDKIC